jgi:hypothetical protein
MHVAQQLSEPFERVVLALDRHDQLLRRRQRVHREESERRGAIQQDEVIPTLTHRRQGLLESTLARELAHEFDLRASQVDRRGDREEVRHRRRDQCILDACLRNDDVVDGRLPCLVPDPHAR